MSIESLRVLDESKMYSILLSLGDHWERGGEIGETAILPDTLRGAKQIVWTGMGGSAIGGNLVQCAVGGEFRIPFLVNRDYGLPAFVGKETLVIAVSYSGNTEETHSALTDAMGRGAKILCVSSGGAIADRAREHNLPSIVIPGGMMPRCGVMFLVAPLLRALTRLEYLPEPKVHPAEQETLRVLRECSAEYGAEASLPLTLAKELRHAYPVVYAPTYLEAAAMRWRGQFAENAKVLASHHLLPEMNHNEIEGWSLPPEVLEHTHAIFLRDAGEPEPIRRRIEATTELVAHYAGAVSSVWTRGESLMARLFSLIALADFTTYYLALFNGVDPTPVDRIGELKAMLAKSKG
jgi:glucose/mannose-6-phosphate isomerase